MIQTLSNAVHLFASWTPAINSAFLFTGIIFVIACIVIAYAGAWKVFVKAGRQGWEAIIPFYGTWVLFEISGKPGWWVLFALIPYIGSVIFLVLLIKAMLELARRFDQSMVFAIIGLIFFQPIGLLILGFGDARYNDHHDDEQSFKAPTSE